MLVPLVLPIAVVVGGFGGTPILGVIVLVLGLTAAFVYAGSRGGRVGHLRTRAPEPTGRVRAAHGGDETANRRQGQD